MEFSLYRRSPVVVLCAPSSSSWTSFRHNLLTAARKPTCQIGTPHCGEETCNRGFFLSGLIAWHTAVRRREHAFYRVASLHQEKWHNPNSFSNAVSHDHWGNAECLNCRQGLRCHQHSCGRLGCFQTRRYEMSKAIFNGKALGSLRACEPASCCTMDLHREIIYLCGAV
ncbi:hypothetical protein TcCL_NonESM03733 [Trypanosoma cruzi]|nr:hypothetical protein TcCL_NonESM03733 [Trypanosoma cruzi]